MSLDWDKYKPYFTKREFTCRHTGRNAMRPEFMDLLVDIRKAYGKPMVITSGFRDPSHPAESGKHEPGAHTYGLAADIAVGGADAMALFMVAYGFGVRRIGMKQHGPSRYMHIDIGDRGYKFPVALWTYP